MPAPLCFHCLIVSLVTAIGCISKLRAEPEQSRPSVVQATVTDRNDQPIEGAKVVALRWFDDGDADTADTFTNAEGKFEFPVREKQPDEDRISNYVIIYKEGYAVGALNLDYLPARARLWPKKPVALRIVDAQQKPLAGARVTLGEIGFDDEFLHANIPPSLAKEIEVVSRDDGWAILRSTRPEFVHSVIVEAEGLGKQEFATDFAEQKFHLLQLWPTTAAKVRVMVGDRPAADWRVFGTTSDLLAPDPAAGRRDRHVRDGERLLPNGISLLATTDHQGIVEIEHALRLRSVHLMLIGPDGQWRGTGTLVANDDSSEPIILPGQPGLHTDGADCAASVMDASSGDPVAGVDLVFQFRGFPPRVARATSDANGKATTTLSPGSWTVRVTKSPAGYCEMLASQTQFVIPKAGGAKLPDLQVPPGKTIQGVIRGVDLSIRRARWLKVGWHDKDGNSCQLNGRFRPDGSFSVTIPVGATAASFAIVAIGGGNDDLVIASQNPLILEPSP